MAFDKILEYLRVELRESALSESSLCRDFRYMRNELNAQLEYVAKKHDWHYTKAYKLPSSPFTDDETLALHLLQKLISQHSSDDFIFNSMQNLLEEISPSLNSDECDPEALTIYDRFFVPARPKPVMEKGVAEKVLLAVKNNFMLDFYYNSMWEPDERHMPY